MDFKELLNKQIQSAKPYWKIPKVLLAIDPGETTGYSIFKDGELFRHGVIIWKIPSLGYEIFVNHLKEDFPDVVVCEDYRLYANKVNAQLGSQIPTIKIIGAIEMLCSTNKIPMIKQMASTAKQFCTREKLEEWGYWKKINPHARDSIRHATYFLLFCKNNYLGVGE